MIQSTGQEESRTAVEAKNPEAAALCEQCSRNKIGVNTFMKTQNRDYLIYTQKQRSLCSEGGKKT